MRTASRRFWMVSGRRRAATGAVCAVAVLAWAGCAAPAPQRSVQYQVEPWTFRGAPGQKILTEHYEIYTTLKEPVLIDALPGFVEAAFENYRRVLPPTRTPEERMKTYLFVSRSQWAVFTRQFTGPRAALFLKVRNGGYTERGVAVIEYVAHSITFPLFAHEGFHQYVHHYVNTNAPAWVNEGLAVWCEGQRWGTSALKEFDPSYNPSRRNDLSQALISNRLHSLRELLKTNAGEVIDGGGQSVATYYAQLWALFLFLREGAGGKYAAGCERMLAALGEPGAEQYARAAHIWSEEATFNYGESLFRSFIADELDDVEREYFAFLRQKFLEKR